MRRLIAKRSDRRRAGIGAYALAAVALFLASCSTSVVNCLELNNDSVARLIATAVSEIVRHADGITSNNVRPVVISCYQTVNLFDGAIDVEYHILAQVTPCRAVEDQPLDVKLGSAIEVWISAGDRHPDHEGFSREDIDEGAVRQGGYHIALSSQEFKEFELLNEARFLETLRTIIASQRDLTWNMLKLYRLTLHLAFDASEPAKTELLCFAQLVKEDTVSVRQVGAYVEKSFETVEIAFFPICDARPARLVRGTAVAGKMLSEDELSK